MSLPVKTSKSQQISSCLRLIDKNGKSYKLNREQRRKKEKKR